MWNVINGVLNKKANTGVKSLLVNNITVEDPMKIANLLNHHFINTGSLICNKPEGNNFKLSSSSITNSIFLEPATCGEILLIIRKLKNSNTSGDDGIPSRVIKHNANFLVEILCHLVNYSFTSGGFPSQLKTAKVIPIFKKGKMTEMTNYRPVSVLPVFSKIFELAMKCRLDKFLKLNNVISSSQHGFQKGKSTETAIFLFYFPHRQCLK